MSAQCPKCNGMGFVMKKQKNELKMECLYCYHRWLAMSKICPKCTRPNGFEVEGVCPQCYSEQYKS
ncbi:hypothetical protein BIV60_13810 [Bacillus sp. MUM 116]|nr:hypothetical protein BIV60_13810 [Bacillus sp. MUM 116]